MAAQISGRHPACRVELVIIKTTGDKIQDVPLAQIGGKGLFIKEIEEALLTGQVDLAVHSLKDMPAEVPEGLMLGAVPPREDCRDAFISSRYAALAEIPAGGPGRHRQSPAPGAAAAPAARPGSGALERQCGHPPEKDGDPGAGCPHPGRGRAQPAGVGPSLPRAVCPTSDMLPAVGQGALGLEVRTADHDLRELVAFLDDPPTRGAVTAERAFLARLEGGCVVPVAALGRVAGETRSIWRP